MDTVRQPGTTSEAHPIHATPDLTHGLCDAMAFVAANPGAQDHLGEIQRRAVESPGASSSDVPHDSVAPLQSRDDVDRGQIERNRSRRKRNKDVSELTTHSSEREKMFQHCFNIFDETLFAKIRHDFTTLRRNAFTIRCPSGWRSKKKTSSAEPSATTCFQFPTVLMPSSRLKQTAAKCIKYYRTNLIASSKN